MSRSHRKILQSLRATLHIVTHSPHFCPSSMAVREFKRDVESLIAELEAEG